MISGLGGFLLKICKRLSKLEAQCVEKCLKNTEMAGVDGDRKNNYKLMITEN